MPAVNPPITILTYHHIAVPPREAHVRGLYVTPGQFRWQLKRLLAAGCTFTTFRGLETKPLSPGARPVILTADDGHLDFLQNALPILTALRVPAVLFPVAGCLGARGLRWNDANGLPVDIVSAEDLKTLIRNGIEIGSHFMEHVRASDLTADQRMHQLTRSKQVLEAACGTAISSVAYPYGAMTDDLPDQARAAGYRYGVTCERAFWTSEHALTGLPRIPVKGSKLHHGLRFLQLANRMRHL